MVAQKPGLLQAGGGRPRPVRRRRRRGAGPTAGLGLAGCMGQGKGGEQAGLLGKEWMEVSWAWPGHRSSQEKREGEGVARPGGKRRRRERCWTSWAELGKVKEKGIFLL